MSETPTRLLALDVGERRTGLAATDQSGKIALPLATLQHKGMAEIPAALAPIIEERKIQLIVLGVPLTTTGEVGPQAKKVLLIREKLVALFPHCRVATIDESHSSDVAHNWLKEAGMKAAKRKKHVDSLAAVEILRRFLGQ